MYLYPTSQKRSFSLTILKLSEEGDNYALTGIFPVKCILACFTDEFTLKGSRIVAHKM